MQVVQQFPESILTGNKSFRPEMAVSWKNPVRSKFKQQFPTRNGSFPKKTQWETAVSDWNGQFPEKIPTGNSCFRLERAVSWKDLSRYCLLHEKFIWESAVESHCNFEKKKSSRCCVVYLFLQQCIDALKMNTQRIQYVLCMNTFIRICISNIYILYTQRLYWPL